MRDSRRPGGVPDQLETPAVAAAVADEIWTFDGSRWNEVVAGGSCGPETCTLEIAGTPEGAHGEDLYIFSVVPGGEVRLVAAELRGLPASMVGPLDELAHGLVVDGTLDGLLLQSVRWRPPPDFGLFELSYRSGGEEGSCGVDLTIDAVSGRLAEDRFLDC
jgi:hypothetical protein